MAPLLTREVPCKCRKLKQQLSVPHLKKSFNITKPSWKPLQTRKWILFSMKCALSFRPHPMAMRSHNLSCFNRLGWWRSKCRYWSRIRKAWMMSLTMCWIQMPQVRGLRQIWDSRSFMRIAPCCFRWWLPWLNNWMRWRYYMKTLRLLQVMSGPRLMNLRKSCQCKETCIWDHRVAHMGNHSMATWIWWTQT